MEVEKLRQDLTQCWLAEALANVLERAAAKYQLEAHLLVSIGSADGAKQGAQLSALLDAFVKKNTMINCEQTSDDDCYVHVENVEEFRQWMRDKSWDSSKVFCVVYAPQQLETIRIDNAVGGLDFGRRLVVLMLENPSGLVGLAASESRMYHLQDFSSGDKMNTTYLKFITRPLDRLREQCSWRIVMDIVQRIPDVIADNKISSHEDIRTMYTSINQLPFQLLLLVLRWSHFHPKLVQACSKKLQRQMRLIPQARMRRELEILQNREAQLWSGLYPLELFSVVIPDANPTQEQTTSRLLFDSSGRTSAATPELSRLSDCRLWDTQKQFYKDQGIRAWSSGTIPFGVSSSSFLAKSYARVAANFLLSSSAFVQTSKNGEPNCYIWEAASGSCKFLRSFMLHFLELVETEEFEKHGLVPLVVATDLSEQVLESRGQIDCFQAFVERGQLDFALFDTSSFVAVDSSTRKTLRLLHSQRQWLVGSDGPVMLMGNYFLDSLRADVFTVATRQIIREECEQVDTNTHIVVQEVFLAKDTSSIADMDISLRAVEDPSAQPVYEDSQVNETLLQVLQQFSASAPGSTESTGIILFPVEAFQFLLALLDKTYDPFPIAILAGDAGFSFRDAISSAFLSVPDDREAMRLELPQLSPHPDCFCLPVDFEIFKMFFESLNHSSDDILTSSQMISAPASDTFDVFFATVEPQPKASTSRDVISNLLTQRLHISFQHQFAHFTPGDCDLLWGMMSFDDGSGCFSSEALLSLLEQTGWDFDLFAVLHWELLRRWQRVKSLSEGENLRKRLVGAGAQCWKTFYVMEHHTGGIAGRETRLQLARWFYELDAYENVLEALSPWREDCHRFSNGAVGIFYLLGLTCVKMHEHWAALTYFRHCVRLAPTKLKFQRQVTRTLLTLQMIRSASNSSNDSDSDK